MKYIDLIAQLSEEDKVKIKNYISIYGVNIDDFIGLDTWLQDWSHANQRLYKLLGNQFIYKVPYTYNKQKRELASEILTLCARSEFREEYSDFYWNYIKKLKDILELEINNSSNVFIVAHNNPDFDAIGSAIGLARLASYYEKEAYIIVEDSVNSLQSGVKKMIDDNKKEFHFIKKRDINKYIDSDSILIVTDVNKIDMI
jgi:hypothetical protein